jgi:hypothetical protein
MESMVQKIHLNLSVVRVTLAAGINRLLSRGESIERIEAVAAAVSESGKAFHVEVERQVSTPWQRCCGKGRWMQWACPCVPLCRWLGVPQKLCLLYEDCMDWVRGAGGCLRPRDV